MQYVYYIILYTYIFLTLQYATSFLYLNHEPLTDAIVYWLLFYYIK